MYFQSFTRAGHICPSSPVRVKVGFTHSVSGECYIIGIIGCTHYFKTFIYVINISFNSVRQSLTAPIKQETLFYHSTVTTSQRISTHVIQMFHTCYTGV